jgi:hypothetical protein
MKKYFLKIFGGLKKINSSLQCKTNFKNNKHATHTTTYRIDEWFQPERR